ncbi:4Fe-4S ferredoxin iron-sulfur binding domain protein [Desulfurivibrio alkaliphilus AHT 2]|uniref:4Fe-4S ferredoxin iron-sulfur binding domain protein n=1 Tax=Desulfurivibrio alkaliphilus (strain DSM 19089 / UNIQEM U267 / AHT2) TaxID=589865 RepID=D6Z4W3_DESAT|nr:4Fe-4S ferredoxin iron-sulfur binding domain protein [Desulfurivibrio alkaliphilus AHT 2]
MKVVAAAGAAGVAGSSGLLLREDARRRQAAAAERHLSPLPEITETGLVRPPGALPDRQFRSNCSGCGACLNVCHTMGYDAIAMAGPRHGLQGATPYIKDMRDFPCTLCMECPSQCPTGALQPVEKPEVKMGIALIDLKLCFGWNGDVCLSCSKACPLGASVFDFYYGAWGNQPYINEKCVGCGLCVKYCPLGGSAVKVVTTEVYAGLKDEYLAEVEQTLHVSGEERYEMVYGHNLPEIMARGRLVEREYR